MLRYFFHIGYNGFNYHGWQRHAPHLTVQQVLEENIGKILKVPVTISGCGRTDSQVHASQYFFHLDVENEWDYDLAFRLNKVLPEDISVFDIIKVDNASHAQYDAIKRTYNYFIHTYKDPFLNHFSCFYAGKALCLENMKQAIALLTKYKNYRAFCKSPDKYEHTVCNITSANLFSDNNRDKLQIQISSNRFLRGMMRAIIARLLKTGTGEMNITEFENFLISKEYQANIEFAPPQGLYLAKVAYPFLDLTARTNFSPLTQGREKEESEWQLV